MYRGQTSINIVPTQHSVRRYCICGHSHLECSADCQYKVIPKNLKLFCKFNKLLGSSVLKKIYLHTAWANGVWRELTLEQLHRLSVSVCLGLILAAPAAPYTPLVQLSHSYPACRVGDMLVFSNGGCCSAVFLVMHHTILAWYAYNASQQQAVYWLRAHGNRANV